MWLISISNINALFCRLFVYFIFLVLLRCLRVVSNDWAGKQFLTCILAAYISFNEDHVISNQPITFGLHNYVTYTEIPTLIFLTNTDIIQQAFLT